MAKRAKVSKVLRRGPIPGQKPVTRADRLLALRLARGWSQAELAHRAGVSVRQISDVEGGKIDLQLRGFLRVCNALESTADYLLGRDAQ